MASTRARARSPSAPMPTSRSGTPREGSPSRTTFSPTAPTTPHEGREVVVIADHSPRLRRHARRRARRGQGSAYLPRAKSPLAPPHARNGNARLATAQGCETSRNRHLIQMQRRCGDEDVTHRSCMGFVASGFPWRRRRTLRIAGNFAPTHSSSKAMELFKGELKRLTGGSLDADLFPACSRRRQGKRRRGPRRRRRRHLGLHRLRVRLVPEIEAVSLPSSSRTATSPSASWTARWAIFSSRSLPALHRARLDGLGLARPPTTSARSRPWTTSKPQDPDAAERDALCDFPRARREPDRHGREGAYSGAPAGRRRRPVIPTRSSRPTASSRCRSISPTPTTSSTSSCPPAAAFEALGPSRRMP